MNVEVLGRIPYDISMINALLEAKTINEFEPNGLIANKLNEIWNNITTKIYEHKSI
jgi:nitrogenase subunit NifH